MWDVDPHWANQLGSLDATPSGYGTLIFQLVFFFFPQCGEVENNCECRQLSHDHSQVRQKVAARSAERWEEQREGWVKECVFPVEEHCCVAAWQDDYDEVSDKAL